MWMLFDANWIFLFFGHCRISNDNITACLSANRHGLCIGCKFILNTGWHWNSFLLTFISSFHVYHSARGDIAQNSSGVLVALLDQAQKLEPQSGPPVVVLETSKKYESFKVQLYLQRTEWKKITFFIICFCFSACLIHKHGVTGVIVKNLNKSS